MPLSLEITSLRGRWWMEVDRWKGEVLGLPQKFDLGHFCTENMGGRRERRKDGERERRENACERQYMYMVMVVVVLEGSLYTLNIYKI